VSEADISLRTCWLRRLPIWSRIVVTILLLVIGTYTSFGFGVYAASFGTTATTADAAIVMGAAVRNGQPSTAFRGRIDHAISLWRSGKVRKLILTGGRPSDSILAEAEIARNYAVTCGVPEECLFIETDSHTTFQNLFFAQGVARAHGLSSFIIVSDPYHLRRSARIADYLGLEFQTSTTEHSPINNFDFFFREIGRNIKFFALHLLQSGPTERDMSITEH
jgi:uncharacterized SAM-binding protein YcdF (DUF218 family)